MKNDAPQQAATQPAEAAVAPLSLFAGDFKLTRRLQFHASLRDHLPQNYMTALTPPGVRSEFGD